MCVCVCVCAGGNKFTMLNLSHSQRPAPFIVAKLMSKRAFCVMNTRLTNRNMRTRLAPIVSMANRIHGLLLWLRKLILM